jgi:deoxyribonuclease V
VIVCVDVDYRAADDGTETATAACVGFASWTDASAALELVAPGGVAAAYEPGKFFTRELPHLLAILARVSAPLDAIIVDGYTWLAPDRPGLGARLHEARGASEPVIGVAKTRFHGATAIEIVRGGSANPLFVTAIGVDARLAADHIRDMHGPFRIPTMLKRCDSLARGHAQPTT